MRTFTLRIFPWASGAYDRFTLLEDGVSTRCHAIDHIVGLEASPRHPRFAMAAFCDERGWTPNPYVEMVGRFPTLTYHLSLQEAALFRLFWG